jgi:hypothetical protein
MATALLLSPTSSYSGLTSVLHYSPPMPLAPSSSTSPDSPSSSTGLRSGASNTNSVKNSLWRPVIACGGALGLGLVLASFTIKPVAKGSEGDALPEIILPRETTMIVTTSMPPGQLLRGRIRLVADVVGKSPVGGAVARQLVEPGTHVKKGDRVMEISSGGSERPAPAAENLQEKAEQSQIAASDAQSALAQKINIAQSKLRAAQERVERAQSQVGAARDIVRRLQNGEGVASSEIPAPFRSGTTAPVKRVRATKAPPKVDRAEEIALQQAEAAKDAASQGNNGLKLARQMLADAQKSSREAALNLENSTKKVAEVEARFDDKKASGADVEEARADQRDAKSVAAAAERAVASAKAEVAKREKAAASLQKYADKAAADAKDALKNARLFPQDDAEEEALEAPAPSKSGAVGLDQAIKFAGAALEESRRATQEAERLHTEIAGYQRQVTNSNARIESTTENLAVAQQKVLDSVPRARFTSAYAPAEGVVTWVSRLAREVRSGDGIFGIARGGKIGAHFEDKGSLWRGIKPGTVLPAVAVAAKSPTGAAPAAGSATAGTTPLEVVITQVQAPEGGQGAGTIEGEVRTPGPATARPSLGEGTELMVSVAAPGGKPSLTVPVASLVPQEAAFYVAVLTPAAKTVSSPAADEKLPADATPSRSADAPKKVEDAEFKLQWKLVRLGRSDGFRSEVVSGLKAGDRIVASPEYLQQRGFSPEPNALPGVGETKLPQEVSTVDVLVRLTASTA